MSEEHAEEHHTNYIKIWGILVVLLCVSVIGPMFEIQWLTLLTAFGIAVVKAVIVARKFMHIDLEPRFVTYMAVTALVFILLFFAGTSPDVMRDTGSGWTKPAWIQAEADYAARGPAVHHDSGH